MPLQHITSTAKTQGHTHHRPVPFQRGKGQQPKPAPFREVSDNCRHWEYSSCVAAIMTTREARQLEALTDRMDEEGAAEPTGMSPMLSNIFNVI